MLDLKTGVTTVSGDRRDTLPPAPLPTSAQSPFG
jgi:hypothetical protein